MEHNTTTIADCFADAAADDETAIKVGFVFYGEEELTQSRESEEGDKEGVEAERGSIAIDGVFD